MRKRDPIELLTPDGQKLRGIFSYSPNSQSPPVIVFAHGFGSIHSGDKATAIEAECVKRNWAFIACDFRGHGESDGVMNELLGSGLLEDLEAIVREAQKRVGGKLFLFGSSMGGWASAWFAARFPTQVAACAFVAPAFRFLEWRNLTEADRAKWQRTGRHRVKNEFVDVEIGYGLIAEASNFKFETLATRFITPSIIFHGMADGIVPYTVSIDFASSCTAEEIDLVIIKGGDHRLNRDAKKLAWAACDFFVSHL